MLDSMKIQRRQSEIRQSLAKLVGKTEPTEDETRQIETLDAEFRSNEIRYRGALIAEDDERREAGEELETRSDREWSDLMAGFELRQAALHLDEGAAFTGQTAEIVQEMRSQGGYRGVPVPLEALEVRMTADDVSTRPITTAPTVDRLFANSVATAMGGRMVNIGSGVNVYPVSTSAVTAGWQATETGSVASGVPFTSVDSALLPDQTLGVQVTVTRRAMKQSGGIEETIRRDMSEAIRVKLDEAAFQGSGASGEPLGVVVGAATYTINERAIDAAPSWDNIRAAITQFMVDNAAGGPAAARVLMRPEVWDDMNPLISGIALSEYDRLASAVGSVTQSSNALAAPGPESKMLLTTASNGVPPFMMGIWGGVDLIRDPYSDAASGGLRLTGLVTADVTVLRPAQLEVLTGVQRPA